MQIGKIDRITLSKAIKVEEYFESFFMMFTTITHL